MKRFIFTLFFRLKTIIGAIKEDKFNFLKFYAEMGVYNVKYMKEKNECNTMLWSVTFDNFILKKIHDISRKFTTIIIIQKNHKKFKTLC